ncbi:APC family permease [Limosilactobacillus fermentum]|uniref:APC family permease n=1 Tax=Limosilactobacillus fermentum TaxID=1613 RepID=UPI0021A95A55|nr:APC family permease [Limosilactobacillus fermentum]MCT2875810.1 APC family permease [Limosilactobacillus fermentum]
MENKENQSENLQMTRVLGLKESISMTVGTVVGVGLFTSGSAQIGHVGPWIIVFTFLSLLVSIWPALIYAEMSASLPLAGGTYNFAKRGLNRLWANLAGWHYIVSVVAICSGETLAFANYFKILIEQFGISAAWIDSRLIAILLIIFFLVLNFRGIEQSGKAQTLFMFFFWGCSILWFLYMIPKVHLAYFGGFAMDKLPSFKELMYIFGLIWWCYTGFETSVSMGSEVKYPQYTLPRSLKLSVFLVFAVNAAFQWFLVGIVSHRFYGQLAQATAPYANGLQLAGLAGFPIILLCIGIAFGGDLSTINPGIAAPARYIYTMAEDGALPSFLGKIHPKYKTPSVAIILVGIINIILIATGSIDYIASVSLISLAICYMIGCLAYMGLRKRYPTLKRPYVAPHGAFGAYFTIVIYTLMLIYADRLALATAGILTIVCLIFYFLYTKKRSGLDVPLQDEIGVVEEPNSVQKAKIDKQYLVWKWATIIVTIIALGMYVVPLVFN